VYYMYYFDNPNDGSRYAGIAGCFFLMLFPGHEKWYRTNRGWISGMYDGVRSLP
jgi:hypothetical protein